MNRSLIIQPQETPLELQPENSKGSGAARKATKKTKKVVKRVVRKIAVTNSFQNHA